MSDYAEAVDNTETGSVSVSVKGSDTLSVALSELSSAIVARLALHGLKQKLVDSYSGAKKAVEDGEYDSREEYAAEQVARIINQLKAGEWSAKREGTGGPRTTLLAQAAAEVLGITVEEATAKLSAMDDETKKKISKAPKVALVLARLRKEAEARREAKLKAEAEGSTDNVAALFG